MYWPDRITLDPAILKGKPVIKGHPVNGGIYYRSLSARMAGI